MRRCAVEQVATDAYTVTPWAKERGSTAPNGEVASTGDLLLSAAPGWHGRSLRQLFEPRAFTPAHADFAFVARV
jgi:hypothetical protein